MKKYIISFLGFLLAVAIIMPVVVRANPESDIANCFFSDNQGGESCSQFDKYQYGVCENTNWSAPKKGCDVLSGCADGSACKLFSDFNLESKNLFGTNQIVDPWEECDDNNKTNGDGCSADGKIERGWKCTPDDANGLSFCAPIVGSCGQSTKICTLFNPCVSGAQCIFGGSPNACVPGAGQASICQNGVAVPCATGSICLGGKCQKKNDDIGAHFINGFNPNLETIIFVPGAGTGMTWRSPNQIRGISDEYGDRFNFVYFSYSTLSFTENIAKDLNVVVGKILKLNEGYDKKIKLVSHSYSHLVVRAAILRANGYTQSSPNVSDKKIADEKVAAAYKQAEYYSVSGVIGGSDYSWIIPIWPSGVSKFSELNPASSFENWLFSENSVNKFKSEIGGYYSFDAVGDQHLKELENCGNPGFLLSKWCVNYQRGISSDNHIKFGLITNNLLSSDKHPGFSDADAQAILDGLKIGYGAADKDYCKNGLITSPPTNFMNPGGNVGHSALLFHPTVIAKILEDNKPNLWISDRPSFSVSPISVQAGGTVTLSNFKVMNDGDIASGAFNLGLYLSNDATISTTSDTRLEMISFPRIEARSFLTVRAPTLTIPANTSARNFYVGAIVDPSNAVSESNENDNNLKKTPLTVTVNIPPTVTITSPANNQLVTPGWFYSVINFSGSIKKVEMYITNTLTGAFTKWTSSSSLNPTSPFTVPINIHSVNTTTMYTIKFVVTDSDGQTASAERTIKVTASTQPPTPPPPVSSPDTAPPTLLMTPGTGPTEANTPTRIVITAHDPSGVASIRIIAQAPPATSPVLEKFCNYIGFRNWPVESCYLDVPAEQWVVGTGVGISAVDYSPNRNTTVGAYIVRPGQLQGN